MRRMNTILPILVLALAAVGCASNTDRHWGESQTALTESQIANPVAALRNADKDVDSLDGNSASNAIEKLRIHELDRSGKSNLPDIIQIGAGN